MIRTYKQNYSSRYPNKVLNAWVLINRERDMATIIVRATQHCGFDPNDGDRLLGRASYTQMKEFVKQIQTDAVPVSPTGIQFQFNVFMATQHSLAQ